jgi:apolipoprotein N-acyltransferase
MTKRGGQVLVNLTNDAWFGHSSAPFQHLSMAVFRAVENRRPLVRSANTGFSAFIDANGVITSRSCLFCEDILVHDVSIQSAERSVYTRYGDVFAVFLLILSLLKFFHLLCYTKIFYRIKPVQQGGLP